MLRSDYVDFDILFDHATAAAYRCELTSDGTAQPCWNNMPVVDPVTITEDVAKELVEWFWTTFRNASRTASLPASTLRS